MSKCTCHPVPFEDCTTYGSAVEPGSAFEPNPNCPEHFPKRGQTCKDCGGRGYVREPGWNCDTCAGLGKVHRVGPYRLADGTWSDGVDRAKRLDYRDFNSRIAVWKGTYSGRWFAGHEFTTMKGYGTFEEAVSHADRAARTTKNGDNK